MSQAGAQEIWGKDVGLRVEKQNGEWIETLLAKDRQGQAHAILESPTAPGLPLEATANVTALRTGGQRLFSASPTLRFTNVSVAKQPDGSSQVVLKSATAAVSFTKTLDIPAAGNDVYVSLRANFTDSRPLIEYLFASYAFTPDGLPMSKSGPPDSTFSPGLRTLDNEVVGDHFFRAPALCVQKGNLAALLMPDVDVLAENRPMPTSLDLDCKPGVVDAPLMSYGFCDYKLASHIAFSHDPSMLRRVPGELLLAMNLFVTADADPFGAYQIAARESWKVGEKYFDKILPQARPFAEYAKECYPAAFAEKQGDNQLGWFDVEIDGKPCGGVMAGWNYEQGWVSWQDWFNNLRSAWGMHWWGEKLGQGDWVDKSNKMLNLALAAPLDQGACPTTYQSREKQWKGSLITPSDACYYDLTNMAWKGIWLLNWLDFKDCPRKDEIIAQCVAMADCMAAHQNPDGSIPTWLDKNLAVVPILDHSAQTALPAWFMAALSTKAPNGAKYLDAAKRAADFLVGNVVDQQRYYDFETFFSCSAKTCRQTNGVLDDARMHDPHTLCPPQNTLSMQWTAEALRNVGNLTKNPKYMPYALKALDMMDLYQNVWPISYRHVAYTFGGFGVQNSDGEYNDARQAQFGATLCDFGAQLDRKDLFERGVAATRAALTLINDPLHREFGIYPFPNYPPGLEPENCGHSGGDTEEGRTGFDWGEGSGLTSMAYLLDRYGETYQSKDWSVLVDGGSKGIDMLKAQGPLVDPTFDFSDWRMKGWIVFGSLKDVPTTSARKDFGNDGKPFVGTAEDGLGGYDDAITAELISPKFKVTKAKITLLVGGGAGEGEFVELLDADSHQRIYVEHGKNDEKMDLRTWDVSALHDKVLQIRILDRETAGWGHINVGDIRCSN